MKKKVTITRTIEVEIDIHDKLVSENGIRLFNEHMWEIESRDAIIDHVAHHIVNSPDGYIHDFIGLLGQKDKTYNGAVPDTLYTIIDDWTDVTHDN